jgi:DNA polymerase III delta prime subunit
MAGYFMSEDNNIYKDNWAHLADELERLVLKVNILMVKQKLGREDNPLDQFKGFVISEDEIQSMLNNDTDQFQSEPEYLRLMEKLLELDSCISRKRDLSSKNNLFLPLEHLTNTFKLSFFEEQCIILALAVELDMKYEKLYAFLQDDITKKYPTINLALSLFCNTTEEVNKARHYFNKSETLVRFFLRNDLESSSELSWFSKPLKLDKRIIDFLLISDSLDKDISDLIEIVKEDTALPELLLSDDIQEKINNFIKFKTTQANSTNKAFVFYLWGPAGSGKRFNVKHFCNRNNMKLILVDVKNIKEDTADFIEALRKTEREAFLRQGVLCFYNFDALISENDSSNEASNNIRKDNPHKKLNELFRLIKDYEGIAFILADCNWDNPDFVADCHYLSMQFTIPHEVDRKFLWESLGKGYKFDNEINWGMMAGKFRFTPGQILSAIEIAGNIAGYSMPETGLIKEAELNKACFSQSKHNLKQTALRIESRYFWDDIILPQSVIEQLKNICNQMKYRHIVYGDWGFNKKLSYGKGLCALLFGPPGTGKTMTAQVIANELKLELFRIDLSQVISKYIGETEKNLQMIFEQAEASNAILFFDEADAIFGKRSEVKDAHDRYANIETSYLLQKVEEYEGMTILATNFKENIDEAFTRRIQHIVEFPFPDSEHREKIWRMLYPKEAPLDKDIDFEFIAKRFEIAGGNIKNIVVSSAFLAAQTNEAIQMKHIISALKYELHKTGRVLLKEDLGEYCSDL